jgi:predicted Zn-dependent peptidase
MNSSVFVSCLADKVDETLALLKDALFAPRFDEKDFKRIKEQIL